MTPAGPSPPTGDVSRRSPEGGTARGTASLPGESAVDARAGLGEAIASVLLIWGLFLALSLIRWPIPGINEPHYLTKGRHFVDPQWIRGDFFLDSANPHAAASWLLGELAVRMPFETAALIGRILGFGVLALGWTVMLRQALATPCERRLATGLFLFLHLVGNWSGEWLLRGVEGKVFAWGFLFLATGLWPTRREWLAGMSLGAALTFHPVIGAWGAIAAGLSVAWEAVETRDLAGLFRRAVVPIMFFGLFAAPGLLGALPTLRLGTPDERWQADHIQVTQRLAHHLDPATFAWASHREYLLLLGAIWLLGRRGTSQDPASGQGTADRSFLERMAWSSVLCAVGGIVVSIWPRTVDHFSLYVLRLKLLKLYPFRLADIFVPLLLAVRVVEFPRFAAFTQSRPRAFLIVASLVVASFIWPGDEGPARRMSAADYDHWRNLLAWIREQTPRGAVVQAMNEDFAVKWHTERAEYVAYKDCPQDAPGILEWHRRLTTLDQGWRTPAMADLRVTAAELEELHRLTGIDYLLCSRFGPIDAPPVHVSGPFRVYATSPHLNPASKE